MPDRRQDPRRPAPVPPAQVSPGSSPPGRGGDEVVYRGVRWRRSTSGRIIWHNDGLRRWVGWEPGSDAPPLPEQWRVEGAGPATAGEPAAGDGGPAGGAGGPAGGAGSVGRARVAAGAGGPSRKPGLLGSLPGDAMSRRPPMLSPYRLVPIIVAVLIVGAGVYQATRPPTRASAAEVAAAEALKGRCLARQGGTSGAPVYSTAPVGCGTSAAAVRVVAVRVQGAGRSVVCPRGSTVAQVLKAGVVGEPFECLAGLARK